MPCTRPQDKTGKPDMITKYNMSKGGDKERDEEHAKKASKENNVGGMARRRQFRRPGIKPLN